MQPKPWLVDTRKAPAAGARERAALVEREVRADEQTRAAKAYSQPPYQPGGQSPVVYDAFTTGEPPAEPARERLGVTYTADAGDTAPLDRYHPGAAMQGAPHYDTAAQRAALYHPVSDTGPTSSL